MLRLNNSCCECNPQICLGLRVRRVCAACGQTMAIFHSELPCPILFLISQLKRTTILRPLSPPFARYELEANFYQFSKTSTQSGDPTDKISPFFFSPPPWKVWNGTVRNEEKFATISYEADSRDTKGARKSLRFRPEDIFSTLSGDGVSSYRPRLHLDSRLLVL